MKFDMDKKKKRRRWNSSFKDLSSICTEPVSLKLEFLLKNLGTRVSETQVSIFFIKKKKEKKKSN